MNTQHSYTKEKNQDIEKFLIFPPTRLQEENKMAEHNQAAWNLSANLLPCLSTTKFLGESTLTNINMRHTHISLHYYQKKTTSLLYLPTFCHTHFLFKSPSKSSLLLHTALPARQFFFFN